MNEWKQTKLGEKIEANVLSIWLGDDFDNDQWSVFLYPRRRVTIGGKTEHDRIAVLKITAKTREDARVIALELAEEWLEQNVDELLGESCSPR